MVTLPHRACGLRDLRPIVGIDVAVGGEHAMPGEVLEGR